MIFTSEQTRGLALCLRDMLPIKFGNGFHAVHWEILMTRLKNEYGCDVTKAQVRNKYDQLRKKYTIYHKLMQSTSQRDPETGKIVVTDEFWNEYIKRNPLAEKFKFRERPFEAYDIMHQIVNGNFPISSTRTMNQTLHDISLLSSRLSPRPNIQVPPPKRKKNPSMATDRNERDDELKDVNRQQISTIVIPTTPLPTSQSVSPSSPFRSDSLRPKRRKTGDLVLAEDGDDDRLASASSHSVMSAETKQRVKAVKLLNREYKDWDVDERALALRVMKDIANVQIFLNTEAGETRDRWLQLEMNALSY
ncbi:hypothetical protein K3495_g2504 [Podosphaera aphanis]|nr:hypothetical protein K3495_g2504 [Podosphaera aphanis]